MERFVRRIDVAQQGHRPVAFVFAVFKKFGDDRGSVLAALLAYYGFVAIFPLLLLLVTVLGIVLSHDVRAQERILHSTLREFPIIGDQLARNVRSLRARGFGVAIGIAGLVWGSLGVAQVGQFAMAEVWNIRGVERPNFVKRMIRSVLLLAVLGAGVTTTTVTTTVATSGRHGPVYGLINLAISGIVNVALFVVAFRVLTPRTIALRNLRLGAVLAGLGWTALQTAGGYLVAHQLRHASQVYGLFGLVLGLLSFLTLAATISLYCAELNVVWARRLWPRSIVQPPLTTSDRRVLADIAEQGTRRPEQIVDVRYRDLPDL